LDQLTGNVINRGIAYGRVYKRFENEIINTPQSHHIDQMDVLMTALSNSAQQLDELARITHYELSEGVSIIFEAHKLMINDPMILERAKALIAQNHSAYNAYRTASDEVIGVFEKLDNDYMKNRIIDIEDAAERVLSAIENVQYGFELKFPSPRILLLEKMKPSVLVNCHKDSILGIVSASGSYNQHSGTIVRIKDIPTLVIKGVMEAIHEKDRVLIDAVRGVLYRNPSMDFVNKLMKERR